MYEKMFKKTKNCDSLSPLLATCMSLHSRNGFPLHNKCK